MGSRSRSGQKENTLVICTTDHGLAFPHMKCTLTDFGTGVFFMMRWPESFRGGTVTDALASQVDLIPTLCELLDLAKPENLQGTSLVPAIHDPMTEVQDRIFGEVTYHAAAEPMRSVRSKDLLYIKRFGDRLRPNGANCDVSYSKKYLVARGLPERSYVSEELYDLTFDPQERNNVATDPAYAEALKGMQDHLHEWMCATDDVLIKGIEALPQDRVSLDPDVWDANNGGAPPPVLPPQLEVIQNGA